MRTTTFFAMRISVFAAACFCVSSAFANTVLWYRFEEHEPGYVMTSSDRVTNEVDAATMVGRPVSNLASFWPSYAATPQGFEGVYDPVTGKVYPNNVAMSLSQTVNADNCLSEGPHIETPDCEALHLQSFTIEMFAERNGNYRAQECLVRKLANTGADTRCNYYLYRAGIGSNYHYARVCVTDETGAFESGHWKASTSGDVEDDKLAGQLLTTKDFWDHIALTYDAATRTATLYRNYKVVKSFTFAEGFSRQVYIDKPLQIGGCGQSLNGGAQGTNFGGLIDEVRISDTALQPSKFLRLCSPVALPETTHLYTFDCATNFSWNSTTPWRNLAPVMKESSSAGASNLTYTAVGVDESEAIGASVRSGLLSGTSVVNNGSFHTSTNIPAADASSAYIKAFGRKRFFATDFTFEMAFKMPPQPSSSLLPGASDSGFLVFAGLWGVRVFRGSTGQLSFYDGSNYSLGRYTDNEWHRLAYVFEKESGLHRIYVDGVQKFAKTRSRTPDTADDWYLMSEGNQWGSSWGLNLSAGWIDDVRVTEKALRPCEFLTSLPKEAGNTLAWYSFENNSLDNGVYTNAIGAGALGGTAAFYGKTPGKGKELWDSTETKIRDNSTSLAIDGGKAVWPRNSLIEREDLTVEFFARQTAASANAGIVSAMRSDSGTNSTAIVATDAIWSIRVGSDGKTPEVYVNNASAQTVAFPASSALGSAWRHYAVTFVPNGDDTTVKLCCNHELVVTQTITGKLQLPSATGGAIPMLGTTGAGSAAFNGAIDEVRVSLGEVAVGDMLYAPPSGGLVLMYK